MREKLRTAFDVLKQTIHDWVEDKAPRLGAALAYYTVFSIAPLIIIVIAIAGVWFGKEQAQAQIIGQIAGLLGEQGAQAISGMLQAADKPHKGLMASLLAVVTLAFGATGVFVQLQDALNAIWEVKPKPGRGVMGFVRQRLLSLAMVFGIGFLLLVSLVLSTALAAAGKWVEGVLPGGEGLWQAINFIVSFVVIAALFTLMFKYLPDVKIAWKDVWLGGVLTAVLFTVGKFALGMYLGRSSVSSAYGAAGSLVIVLLWVYYSAQILFFGAEFTQVYANRFGKKLEPAKNAMWAPGPKEATAGGA
ncbi:MAG TPA: YihY/virulence factor BrkB family protein [Methylomirabilota bacterium]|nr:YihY/virulence factor BrkB family protein [Methylomirabilota bacterium]